MSKRKVWRDIDGQWYEVDYGQARNPFDKEGCEVLDKLFKIGPCKTDFTNEPALETETAKVCGTCQGAGHWHDTVDTHVECPDCNGTGKAE
jgi:hypothetical protein